MLVAGIVQETSLHLAGRSKRPARQGVPDSDGQTNLRLVQSPRRDTISQWNNRKHEKLGYRVSFPIHGGQ